MAQFDSPFVAQLVGLVTIDAPMLMVVEYAEYGSLKSYLEEKEVDERLRLLWAGDVAEGMAHVHAKGFLHRDLATRNVLVGSDLRCKISDFGLAREVDEHDTYYRSRGGQLPVRWTAPEALESRKFSEKTDAWSFGVTLYELWTQAELPYKSWNNQRVWVEVANGARLPQPAKCSDVVYRVMLSCWAANQPDRPTFAALQEELRQLYMYHDGKPAPEPASVAQARAAQAAQAAQGTNTYMTPSPVGSQQASRTALAAYEQAEMHTYDDSDAVQEGDSGVGAAHTYDDAQMSPTAPPQYRASLRQRAGVEGDAAAVRREGSRRSIHDHGSFYSALKTNPEPGNQGNSPKSSLTSLPREVYELAVLAEDGYQTQREDSSSPESEARGGGGGGGGSGSGGSGGHVLELDWDDSSAGGETAETALGHGGRVSMA